MRGEEIVGLFVILTLISMVGSLCLVGLAAFSALHWLFQLDHNPAIISAGIIAVVLGIIGLGGLAAGAHN